MLNVNSPTVQAMLANTPQGFGNMPVYNGNTPMITTQTVQQPMAQPSGTPFPSPKEMLAQGGQQAIYAPTSFYQPRNIVGGYNPGFQSAFGNYYNPYMGVGAYGGYGYGQNPFMQQPIDDDSRDRLEAAIYNNLTYDEQLQDDSNLFKSISRIVSKYNDRSEEEAAACEKRFEIYNKYPKEQPYKRKPIKYLHAKVTIGDQTVAEAKAANVDVYVREDYRRCGYQADYMKARQEIIQANMTIYRNQLYERAPERAFDRTNLLDFFNNGAGVVLAYDMIREIQEQAVRRTSQIYNSDNFRERLLKNNGIKTRAQRSAIERFTGRYGVMPDGRPVSPGHDPAVASSFSYNPNTGQYEVQAPNFIRDRLEMAKQSFIRSLDES